MKELWKSLIRSLPYLFSIIGIVLTIYFSVYYVPGYTRDYQNEKINRINQELIDTIEELIYNDEDIDLPFLETLIKGKELKSNILYTYTTDELLIQVQEKFMDNNFIPLTERRKIITKISNLRNQIYDAEQDTSISEHKEIGKTISFNFIISIFSIIVGLASAIIGAWSLLLKYRRERNEEIDNAIESRQEQLESTIKSSLAYEDLIEDILNNLELDFVRDKYLNEADFVISLSNNRKVFIETKYSNKLFPIWNTQVYQKFIDKLLAYDAFGILVLSDRAIFNDDLITAHNNNNPDNTLKVITGTNAEDLKIQIHYAIKGFTN